MRSLMLGRLELRRLRREPLVLAALALIVSVPLLYGALYLWAFWDPYGHVDAIPVALVNEDHAATADGKTLHAGDDLAKELLHQGTLAWHEVSPAEAEAGLADGRYYMALTIPRDFSHRLASASGSHPESATLDARYAESRNMIASTIGQRVFAEVRAAAGRTVDREYFDNLFVGYATVRTGMSDATDGSRRLASGLKDARLGSLQLLDGGMRASAGADDLKAGLAALAEGARRTDDGASQVTSGSAELASQLAAGAASAPRLLAGSRQVADGSAQLAGKLGDAEAGAQQLAGGARRVADGSAQLAGRLGDAEAGALQLAGGVSALGDGTRSLAYGLGRLDASSAGLTSGAHDLAGGTAQVADGVAQTASQLAAARDSVSQLDDGAGQAANALAAYAVDHPEAKDDPRFAGALEALAGVHGGLGELGGSLDMAKPDAERLVAGAQQARDGAAQLDKGVAAYTEGVSASLEGAQRVAVGADDLGSGAGALAQGVDAAHAGASGLASGAAGVDGGAAALASGMTQAHTGAVQLADGAGQLDGGVYQLATGLRAAATGSAQLAAGASALASGSARVADGSVRARDGATELSVGLTALLRGQRALAAGVGNAQAGAARLATGLADGLAQVPAYTPAQRDAHAAMMSDPIGLNEQRRPLVPTYGTGFAPYFIPLALWVGALVTFFLVRPVDRRRLASTAPDAVVAFAGYWPAVAVTAVQAVVLLLVLQFGIGLAPTAPLATYALALLAALTFTAILQALNVGLGPAGKFVGIVLLMLQLTSAAGTFPIETAPAFFRAVHPFLPMTYVVDGLRQTVSGGDLRAAGRDAAALAGFLGAALTLTVASVGRARMWTIERLKPVLEL